MTPSSPILFNVAWIACFTADTSPVIMKNPFPPKPRAILMSTISTLAAFTATSAAITDVKAEIVSTVPTALSSSTSVTPEIAGNTLSLILSIW